MLLLKQDLPHKHLIDDSVPVFLTAESWVNMTN